MEKQKGFVFQQFLTQVGYFSWLKETLNEVNDGHEIPLSLPRPLKYQDYIKF